MLAKEVWKNISGYGDYCVSNFGRVRHGKHMIHLSVSAEGYLTVSLRCRHKSRPCYVHRPVAEAFLPNPHRFKVVNHKDEDKQNDQVSNLEWCTTRYNIRYGSRSWKQSRANFYSVRITKDAKSRVLPSMASANRWLRKYGGVRASKFTIRVRLRRCCWGKCQDVFGYQARFVPFKGSVLQLSLFNRPRQISLF